MASRTVRARLDPESERALEILLREGRNESEAVRIALTEAAARRRTRSALRAEAARVAADPHDRAEMALVRELMDELAPDWPA